MKTNCALVSYALRELLILICVAYLALLVPRGLSSYPCGVYTLSSNMGDASLLQVPRVHAQYAHVVFPFF